MRGACGGWGLPGTPFFFSLLNVAVLLTWIKCGRLTSAVLGERDLREMGMGLLPGTQW